MAEENGDTGGKGGGLTGLLVPAGLAGAVALGVSYLDPFAPKAEADTTAKEAEQAPVEEPGLLILEPMIVSLVATEGQAGRLRLAVALRGPHEAEPDQALALRDALTATVRDVPPGVLAGSDGLSVLRAAMLAAARGVLGEDAVSGVLITDFVLV